MNLSSSQTTLKTEGERAYLDKPVTVIAARSERLFPDWRELWRYRELMLIIAERDLKVRYKQTVIGVLWVLLQPLLMMLVLWGLFSQIGALPKISDVPYPLIVLTGLVVWRLFSYILMQSSDSVISNQHLVSKVYCPRLIFPLSSAVSSLVDLGVCLALLGVMMGCFGVWPTWRICWAPVFLCLGIVTSLSAGILFAALNTLYRDLRHIVPFLIQLLYYLCPVIYETPAVVSPKWQPLYGLNPMVGVIEGFRWSVLGTNFPNPWLLCISMLATGGLLCLGLVVFVRMERRFVDWI